MLRPTTVDGTVFPGDVKVDGYIRCCQESQESGIIELSGCLQRKQKNPLNKTIHGGRQGRQVGHR